MRKVLSERFDAQADDGEIYEVHVYQAIIEYRYGKMKGSIEYLLSDGRDLDPKADGTFEIVQTGEIIRKIC